jgi:thiol-disulfide isomerase/thioredoxin
MSEIEPESKLAPTQGMSRRSVLAGAGVVAAMAGAGVALWQSHPTEPVVAVPVDGFWAMHWETPQGGVVKLSDFRGKPLLINFWATWCPPCIEELPLINDFYVKNKSNGWQVLGLAVDKPSSVQSYLKRLPLDFPVGLAGLYGSELGKNLGNISESLPFSVAIGSAGGILQRKLGRLSAEDLAQWSGLK